VPVPIPQKKGEPLSFAADEHPRADTTLDALTKLKGVVRPDGTVTAGNASGVNDGSCALLLASEEAAAKHGLRLRARVIATATAGVPPRIMGIGPVPATRKVLALAKLSLGQLAVTRQLGLADDAEHVNPNGGAIAIGHPLGASGARLAATALNQLEKIRGRYALCTMCIGVGQGIAMVIERV
jgi:acetyl-CoA acyltransferase